MAQRNGIIKLAKLRELMKAVQIGGLKEKGIQALIWFHWFFWYCNYYTKQSFTLD